MPLILPTCTGNSPINRASNVAPFRRKRFPAGWCNPFSVHTALNCMPIALVSAVSTAVCSRDYCSSVIVALCRVLLFCIVGIYHNTASAWLPSAALYGVHDTRCRRFYGMCVPAVSVVRCVRVYTASASVCSVLIWILFMSPLDDAYCIN